MTKLLVGKIKLIVDEVSTALLQIENIKQSSSLSHTPLKWTCQKVL